MNREMMAQSEFISGTLMMLSLILAICVANISYSSQLYVDFIYSPITLGVGPFIYRSWLINLVNDGLMTLFFLVIGLEMKSHWVLGEKDHKTLILSIAAAIGGIVVPASIYLYFNWNMQTAKGWAIPIATDTAFLLGTLSFFSKYISTKLREFILAFSLIDDILALSILAIFYTHSPNTMALLSSMILGLILIILNRSRVKSSLYYLLVGLLLWIAMVKAGIHGTLAGVILALAIPLKVNNKVNHSFHRLENSLSPLVYYIILPIFIFVNAGVRFENFSQEMLLSNISIGIILGLFFGKQIGIASFSYVAIKMNWCALPRHVSWQKFYAIAILGGIGFTLSLFIGDLTFEFGKPHYAMKASIIIGSLLSLFFGMLMLAYSIKQVPALNENHHTKKK